MILFLGEKLSPRNFELMGSMLVTLYQVRKNLLFSILCWKCIQKAFLESFLNRFFSSKIVLNCSLDKSFACKKKMRYFTITILFIFWMFIQDIYIIILLLIYFLYNLNKQSKIFTPKMKVLNWDKWGQYENRKFKRWLL